VFLPGTNTMTPTTMTTMSVGIEKRTHLICAIMRTRSTHSSDFYCRSWILCPLSSNLRLPAWLLQHDPRGVHNRGLIQVGVDVARSKKRIQSESVRAAGRSGPADPVAITFCGNVTHLCFDFISQSSCPAENHPFCHASVSYRCCLPNSGRNSD
jgi:hypothetical protein